MHDPVSAPPGPLGKSGRVEARSVSGPPSGTAETRRRNIPYWLTTLAGNGFIILGSAFFSILALLTAWVPPRGSAVQFWARQWSRCLLWCSGVRVTAHYSPDISPEDHYVFMANHQSLFDIPVLLSTLPVPTLFMAKRELFQIPLFGWAMRVGGFIPVDRSNQKRARESFREAVARLSDGASVLLFPEETRSADGRLLPFKRGGFLLARKGKAQILPVGIEGTLQVQERSSYGIRASHVTVRYGEPVAVEGEGTQDLPEQIRGRVSSLAGIDDSLGDHRQPGMEGRDSKRHP